MNLFHYWKRRGIGTGTKWFIREWWQNNKIATIVVVVIIILGFLPILPSHESRSFGLRVPYQPDEYGIPRQGIEIRNDCNTANFYYDLKDTRLAYTKNDLYLRTYGFKEPSIITQSFGKYTIAIYGIKACTDCIEDSNLNIGSPMRCLMNKSEVWGYFEECNQKSCTRVPFVVGNKLELVAPDHTFKVKLDSYVKKEKEKSGEYYTTTETYEVEAIITYPKWKPIPYVRWVATALLFILDPIKAALKYVVEKWHY